MNRSRLPIRIAGLAAVVGLLGLLLAHSGEIPVSASFQVTPEPTIRPTATPAPYLELNPSQAVIGVPTQVSVSGGLWQAGHRIDLFWDTTATALGSVQVSGDGTISTQFNTSQIPANLATVGLHHVLAIDRQPPDQAQASFELIIPSPTPTNTSTPIPPPPSDTPVPPTNTPKTPSPTPSASMTPTPSATLRPITPMVTITPLPLTKVPTKAATSAATRTPTRPAGTATNTGTPTQTRTPSPTPGPGTPSATPEPTSSPSPTPLGEISETGGGWGTLFLWGFVLAGLLVAFRLLRVRGLGEQR